MNVSEFFRRYQPQEEEEEEKDLLVCDELCIYCIFEPQDAARGSFHTNQHVRDIIPKLFRMYTYTIYVYPLSHK